MRNHEIHTTWLMIFKSHENYIISHLIFTLCQRITFVGTDGIILIILYFPPSLELLTWVLLYYVHETPLDNIHDELKDISTILLKERM